MYEEFKNLLRELRIKKGIKKRELAQKAGITDMYMYVIESPDRKQLPSDDIIRRLAHALADNEVEEAQILKQLLSAKALARIPEEAKDSIEIEKIEKTIPPESMPVEFIERLKKDLKDKDIDEIADKSGINREILNDVIQYKKILSRKDVISLATVLNQPVYDYLIIANFIPDSVKKLIKHNKISALLRSLEELSNNDLDALIDGIINIIEAYKRKTRDRRKHKSSGKRFPEKE
ncbi:helix-turn-helix transcriptional regulator [Thermodesulfovibrio sp. 1176]|nr:helix-turn-helix transcriptional regulator [Thermodesulfovibrio sp. 1176]